MNFFSMGFIYYNVQETYGFFESLLKAWPFCFYLCGLILSALGGLFTGATALKDMGGTVTAVSQIAENCGYSDDTVFFRTFKTVAGTSPAVWREKISNSKIEETE